MLTDQALAVAGTPDPPPSRGGHRHADRGAGRPGLPQPTSPRAEAHEGGPAGRLRLRRRSARSPTVLPRTRRFPAALLRVPGRPSALPQAGRSGRSRPASGRAKLADTPATSLDGKATGTRAAGTPATGTARARSGGQRRTAGAGGGRARRPRPGEFEDARTVPAFQASATAAEAVAAEDRLEAEQVGQLEIRITQARGDGPPPRLRRPSRRSGRAPCPAGPDPAFMTIFVRTEPVRGLLGRPGCGGLARLASMAPGIPS